MSPGRAAGATCGILLVAAIVACACGFPLIWDGAYQLAVSLVEQKPYFYQTRFHSWFLWWPCVALSRATTNLTALTFAFGLPFIAAPAASVWLSWRLVRRHRAELLPWAVFGAALAGLPGQAFVINDSIWQQTMFWPLFLGAMVPVSRRGFRVLALLAIFQLSHQSGVLLLLAASLASLATVAPTPQLLREQLDKFALFAVLFLLALVKAIWVAIPFLSGAWYDSYASQRMSWDELATTFRDGVLGPPLYGMLAMWFAAFSPFARRRLIRVLGMVALLAGGALWAWWAADPTRWAGAINFRRWVVPCAVPFMIAAAVALRRVQPAAVFSGGVSVENDAMRLEFNFASSSPRPGLFALAPCAALVFGTVITLQSFGWQKLTARLLADVGNDPRRVVPRSAVPWVARTPIDHWGITALVALHEGTHPKKYFAFNADAEETLRAGRIWLGDGHTVSAAPGTAGFFDFRPLVERLTADAR